MKTGFSEFFNHAFKAVLNGNRTYTLWMFGLIVVSMFGLNAFSRQICLPCRYGCCCCHDGYPRLYFQG